MIKNIKVLQKAFIHKVSLSFILIEVSKFDLHRVRSESEGPNSIIFGSEIQVNTPWPMNLVSVYIIKHIFILKFKPRTFFFFIRYDKERGGSETRG